MVDEGQWLGLRVFRRVWQFDNSTFFSRARRWGLGAPRRVNSACVGISKSWVFAPHLRCGARIGGRYGLSCPRGRSLIGSKASTSSTSPLQLHVFNFTSSISRLHFTSSTSRLQLHIFNSTSPTPSLQLHPFNSTSSTSSLQAHLHHHFSTLIPNSPNSPNFPILYSPPLPNQSLFTRDGNSAFAPPPCTTGPR